MLSEADDLLWHQLPTTFDQVVTSDPRFFDRYWFATQDQASGVIGQFTLGVYNNMDVVDAGVAVIVDGEQYNVRSSRSLRPTFESVCAPLEIEVVRPLKEFRLTVRPGEHQISGELTWQAVLPAGLETPHFERRRGRIVQDHQRFNQVGQCTGWLEAGGRRIALDRSWGCRDHSWGIRPGVGVREPVTGPRDSLDDRGYLLALLFFSTDAVGGYVHVSERGSDRTYLSGMMVDRVSGTETCLTAADVEIEFTLHSGTRRMQTATLSVRLDDRRTLRLDCEAAGPAVAMQGIGYSGGFDDGQGLGVWRGMSHVEHEIWDVRDPSVIRLADGTVRRPWHRIQPVSVRSSGQGLAGLGQGSLTLIPSGNLPKYGLSSKQAP
jgi:hypothetical protein